MTTGKKEPEDIFSGLQLGAEDAQGAQVAAQPPARSKPSQLKFILFVAGAVILVGAVGFAVWFFLVRAPATTSPTTSSASPTVPTVPTVPTTPSPTPIVPTAPSTPSAPVTQPPPGIPEPTTNTTEIPSAVAPPPPAPIEGTDQDQDGLTDVEEALYGTSVTNPDTDGDGYSDGSEVTGLYDPTHAGASITQDAGVKVQSWNGHTFLMPSAWTLSADQQDPSKAVIQTGSAATVTLEVRPNTAQLPLEQWLGTDAATATFLTTKNGLRAARHENGDVVYDLASGDTIIVVTYQLNGAPAYDFRASTELIAESLRVAAP